MAILGRIDHILNPKGISISVAPLGAVSAILFTTPSAPAARVISETIFLSFDDNAIFRKIKRNLKMR